MPEGKSQIVTPLNVLLTYIDLIERPVIVMIEKQREKEFLFELERLYHNYYLAIGCTMDGEILLVEVDRKDIALTTKRIEMYIDILREETLEDVR